MCCAGCLRIGRAEADGGAVDVHPGEFFVVPRGVRHNTSAAEETWIALIETVTTEHTGGEDTPHDTQHRRAARRGCSPQIELEFP